MAGCVSVTRSASTADAGWIEGLEGGLHASLRALQSIGVSVRIALLSKPHVERAAEAAHAVALWLQARGHEARLDAARILFEKFAEKNIPVVILKGILFAETIYENPYYKKMNDVDILIRREDLEKVYDVYEELDYFSMGEL